ncbi:type III-B CRISPR module RAMP protein Cmr6 [Anoxybacillus sp. FSL W8-0703]|uniref:type III-B CRISPR module RAMP protein Cmr6 n=1 Tax=Anoxybacillus TaxID=150247 RepID=UPI001867902A|nr:type III-B CRISPR module RAMP protein Cmr6 [Anoxybacillus flavithermus]MBE2924930.1 type III-B CRISPR module RAMP protein Cmr6 [Anoxybacillus flavithermus]
MNKRHTEEKYFLPKDTHAIFRAANDQQLTHLAYRLHYGLSHEFDEKKGCYKVADVQQVAKQALLHRERSFVSFAHIASVRKLKATPVGKMVHGLGAGHVRETSLTIHPTYGIPYIPASSLKGVVRQWWIEAYGEGKEAAIEQSNEATAIFGTQQRRGCVQFYDVYLVNGLQLVPEVMTVHMKKYYETKGMPTDDQSPTPVSFFTVKVTDVDIYLSCLHREHQQAEKLLKKATEWTMRALEELGIGSKTSSGYGYFRNVRDVTEQEFLPLMKQAKEQIESEMQKQQQQKEEQYLASLSPEERLVKEIERLTTNEQDQQKSKSELYKQVIETKNKEAARALQAYWEKIGEWNVKPKRKRQYEKVQAVRALLE